LGPPLYHPEMASRMDEVGVATGLAWTPAGGEILFIEASRSRGHGKLKFTGRLGDVMKESVEAAYSYLRSHIDEVGLPEDLFETTDLHVHVPAGSIPKDGPSAGVAMVVSLASVLTGRRIRHDFAMTGEITLKGRILPVGGVREKVLAARRAGVRTVILPLWNRKDLENIAPQVKEDLRFIHVESIEDVLEAVLDAESMASVYIDPTATATVVAGEPAEEGARRGKCVSSIIPGH
ncbi:MAG: S16 family serine protease, partial [Acidobacteriota bacterium]